MDIQNTIESNQFNLRKIMQLSPREKNELIFRINEYANVWKESINQLPQQTILPSILIAEDCPAQARMIEFGIEKIIKRIEEKRNIKLPEYTVFKTQTVELADLIIKNQIKYDKLLLAVFDARLSDGLSFDLISTIPDDIPVVALSADKELLKKTKELPNVWQCIIKGSKGMLSENSNEYKGIEDIITFSLATKAKSPLNN